MSKFLCYLSIGVISTATGIAYGAGFASGQRADVVLGQPEFGATLTKNGASGLRVPTAVAVEPKTGRVFVADNINNRVLVFTKEAAAHSGASASFVIGQGSLDDPDNHQNKGGTLGADTLSNPQSICIDPEHDRLWVADTRNNRVLGYDHASTLGAKAQASVVYGQSAFDKKDGLLFDFPVAVAWGPDDTLWVSDLYHNRVLGFLNSSADTGALDSAQDLRLGEGQGAISPLSMSGPQGLWVDSAGNLWVADIGANRVLRFDKASAKGFPAPADAVFGQDGFKTFEARKGAAGLTFPAGLCVDAEGTLWVADEGNNRVLGYLHAADRGKNGQSPSADILLGQHDFNAINSDNDDKVDGAADRLDAPVSVVPGADGVLWVSDEHNNRVVRHSPARAFVASVPSLKIAGKKKLTTRKTSIRLKGTTIGPVTTVIAQVGKKKVTAKGTNTWSLKLKKLEPGRTKVTLTAIGTGGASTSAKVTIVRK